MSKLKKILLIFLFALVIGIFYYIVILDNSNQVTICLNDEKITLKKEDKERNINLLTFNSEIDTKIKVDTLEKFDIKVENKKVWNYIPLNLGKVNISKDKSIHIKIKFKDDEEYTEYTINTLPTDFIEFITENNGDNFDGDYYMTNNTLDGALSYVFKLTSDGQVKYYKQCQGFCSQFRKEISSKGKARYVYTAQDTTDSMTIDMNNVYGKFIVMDENYKILDEAAYINNERSNGDKTYTIFEYIDDYHYLITSSNREYIDIEGEGKKLVIQNNIQEIKDGKIVFEWRSADHKKLLEYTDPHLFSSENVNDYLHINKVIIDPEDENILASFRNISTILKINRKTGEIIWSLGGKKDEFNLREPFAYQHSISFTEDHSLLLFNNNENIPANGILNESSVVKIKYDEKAKTIENYEINTISDVYSMAAGGVQDIDAENGIYLVTFGSGIFKEGPVQMIDFKNKKVLFTYNAIGNRMMFSAQKK